jgi:hypothetical protein
MLVFSVPFLLLSDLGLCAVAPKSVDTLEYLKVLANINNGNYTFKGKKTADKPWIYTSQGLEFEAKLKERKFCINIFIIKCH